MDMNPRLTDPENDLLAKILPLQGKHLFTKTLGDGEIVKVTRKDDFTGAYVYYHSNLHEELKLDGNEFLDELR